MLKLSNNKALRILFQVSAQVQDNQENYAIRSYIICTPLQISENRYEMGNIYHTYGIAMHKRF
jgi:hypothetical protein